MEVNFYGVNDEVKKQIEEILENDFTGREFSVMTEEAREEQITEYIKDTLFAFKPSFLAGETDLPEEVFQTLCEKCEPGNEPILKLIEKTCGIKSFVDSAVGADGYGHFLNHYDGEEHEIEVNGVTYYVYRNN